MVPATVVVPLDGSARSEKAIEPALALAQGFGARLDLLRATWDQPPDAEVAYLERLAEELDLDHPGTVTPIGFAANKIVEHLESVSAPLLCLSTRGHTGAGDLVLGSVAIDLLRRTSTPTVLVGPATTCPTLRQHGSPVIYCYDGSPAARRLEPTVVEWAERLHLSVRVTTVLHRNGEFLGNSPAGPVLHDGSELVERIAAAGVTVAHIVLDGVDPARAIADDANAQSAALVVAGSTAHDPSSAAARLTRAVLGSTAERLVRRSPAPVLITTG